MAMKDRWIDILGRHIRALQQADFPDNAICSHHGVSVVKHGMLAHVGLAPHGKYLLITMYGGDIRIKGVHRSTFVRWRRGVRTFGKIIEEWNGKHMMDGISMVIDLEVPPKFQRAIDNYHAMPSPFELRPEDEEGFDVFAIEWAKALEKQGVYDVG
jgi:hypothetical protein